MTVVFVALALCVVGVAAVVMLGELNSYEMDELVNCVQKSERVRAQVSRQIATRKTLRSWVLLWARRVVHAEEQAAKAERERALEHQRREAAEQRLRDRLK